MREQDYSTINKGRKGLSLRADNPREQGLIQGVIKKEKPFPAGIISINGFRTSDFFSTAVAIIYEEATISLGEVRIFAGLTPPSK